MNTSPETTACKVLIEKVYCVSCLFLVDSRVIAMPSNADAKDGVADA